MPRHVRLALFVDAVDIDRFAVLVRLHDPLPVCIVAVVLDKPSAAAMNADQPVFTVVREAPQALPDNVAAHVVLQRECAIETGTADSGDRQCAGVHFPVTR